MRTSVPSFHECAHLNELLLLSAHTYCVPWCKAYAWRFSHIALSYHISLRHCCYRNEFSFIVSLVRLVAPIRPVELSDTMSPKYCCKKKENPQLSPGASFNIFTMLNSRVESVYSSVNSAVTSTVYRRRLTTAFLSRDAIGFALVSY